MCSSGNIAVFKVVATGDPKPEVSWRRTKGPITDKKKFLSRYDESTGEHILEVSDLNILEVVTAQSIEHHSKMV